MLWEEFTQVNATAHIWHKVLLVGFAAAHHKAMKYDKDTYSKYYLWPIRMVSSSDTIALASPAETSIDNSSNLIANSSLRCPNSKSFCRSVSLSTGTISLSLWIFTVIQSKRMSLHTDPNFQSSIIAITKADYCQSSSLEEHLSFDTTLVCSRSHQANNRQQELSFSNNSEFHSHTHYKVRMAVILIIRNWKMSRLLWRHGTRWVKK